MDTIKGFSNMLTKSGKKFAEESGATLYAALQEAGKATASTGHKTAMEALEAFRFVWSEQFIRGMAANAAKNRVPGLAKKLMLNPTNSKLRKTFKELLISPDDVIKQKGILTEEQIKTAGNSMARLTQGKADVIDLPFLVSTPEFAIMSQFKKFMVFQTKFMKDNIIKESAKGNLIPAVRYAMYSQALGEPIADIRSFFSGKERPRNGWRLLDNVMAVGTLGLLGLVAEQSEFGGAKSIGVSLAGATISDIAETFNALYTATKMDIKPGVKFLSKQAPYIGARLAGKPGAILGAGTKILTDALMKEKTNKSKINIPGLFEKIPVAKKIKQTVNKELKKAPRKFKQFTNKTANKFRI
jgi:hypothetical protein